MVEIDVCRFYERPEVFNLYRLFIDYRRFMVVLNDLLHFIDFHRAVVVIDICRLKSPVIIDVYRFSRSVVEIYVCRLYWPVVVIGIHRLLFEYHCVFLMISLRFQNWHWREVRDSHQGVQIVESMVVIHWWLVLTLGEEGPISLCDISSCDS